eukprot:gene9689-28839_t
MIKFLTLLLVAASTQGSSQEHLIGYFRAKLLGRIARFHAIISSRSLHSEQLASIVTKNLAAPANSTEECTLCKAGFKELATLIPANFTLQELTADMDKVCTELKNFTTPCKLLVLTLAPKIYDSITGKTTPEATCQELKLCPANAVVAAAYTFLDAVRADPQKPICGTCIWAFGKIATELKKPSVAAIVNETSFTASAKWACAKIFTNDTKNKNTCNLAVTLAAPSIWKDFDGENSPTDVCTKQLKVCPGGISPKIVQEVCDSCTKTLIEVATDFPSNFTEQMAEDALTKGICSSPLFPANYTATCNTAVKQLTPPIFNALSGKTAPLAVCSKKKDGKKMCCSHEAKDDHKACGKKGVVCK